MARQKLPFDWHYRDKDAMIGRRGVVVCSDGIRIGIFDDDSDETMFTDIAPALAVIRNAGLDFIFSAAKRVVEARRNATLKGTKLFSELDELERLIDASEESE
jgi:hypothetical protein